jgi:hypothetical protein
VEFRIGNCVYRQTSKINAKDQLKIIKKISPLLASGFGEILPLIAALKKTGVGNAAELTMLQIGEMSKPVARELAAMPDADSDYIIAACLNTLVRRKDGEDAWVKIWVPEAGRAAFDDINDDFTVMVRIALGVFAGTFQSFLPAGLSRLIAGNQGG